MRDHPWRPYQQSAWLCQNVLIASDTLPPDPNGVALVAAHTAAILSEYTNTCVIGPSGWQAPAGVGYCPIARSPIGTADFHFPVPIIRNVVRNVDHVIVHTLGPIGCMTLRHSRRVGVASTLFLHNDLPLLVRSYRPGVVGQLLSHIGRSIENWGVRTADRVIASACNAHAKAESLRLYPPQSAERLEYSHRATDIEFVYHGRISRDKGLDVVLKALAPLAGERRAHLRLVGTGSSLGAILRMARELGVNVTHIGWNPNPIASLRGADVYVNASRHETFSLATLEAMGSGLPVVVRRVGAIPSYISHGITGLLFEDDKELAPLLEMVANDAALRARLGRNAYESGVGGSLWDQFAHATLDLVRPARLFPTRTCEPYLHSVNGQRLGLEA